MGHDPCAGHIGDRALAHAQREDTMARDDHVARELIKGVIAGAVATWAMDKVTTYLYEHESQEVRHREDSARHGKTAYGVAAEKLAHAVGVSLDGKEGAAGR